MSPAFSRTTGELSPLATVSKLIANSGYTIVKNKIITPFTVFSTLFTDILIFELPITNSLSKGIYTCYAGICEVDSSTLLDKISIAEFIIQ